VAITFGTPLEYFNNSSFATGETINLSTDAGAGDCRVLFIIGLPNGTTPGVDSFSVDLPSGWTNIAGDNSSATSDQYIRVCYRKFVGGDGDTQAITFTGGSLAACSVCVTVHGADPDTFLDVAVPAVNRPNANAQWTCPAITTVTDDAMICYGIVGDGTVGSGLVDGNIPSGTTLLGTQANATPSNGWGLGACYINKASFGTQAAATWGTLNEEHCGVTFAIRPGVAYTTEQDSFRFYDDGTESGSTALETQNVDLTRATETPFQLRVGGQMTGDAPAISAELQYKETSDAASEWRKVP
jgi:hypothetical protein